MDAGFGSIALSGGALNINGTDSNDTAHVRIIDEHVQVTLNDQIEIVPRAEVGKIVFHGEAGNDAFWNETALVSLAYGGRGDDTLMGGSGQDSLFGEAGKDIIDGRLGRDTLGAHSFVGSIQEQHHDIRLDGDTLVSKAGVYGIATRNDFDAYDTVVEADVNLVQSDTFVTLLARYSNNNGKATHYEGLFKWTSSKRYLFVIARVVDGQRIFLRSGAITTIFPKGAGKVELSVTGNVVEMSFNGKKVISYEDKTPITSSGTVGIKTGHAGHTINQFKATENVIRKEIYAPNGTRYVLYENGRLVQRAADQSEWKLIRKDVVKMFHLTKYYHRLKFLRSNGDVEEWGRNGGLHLTKYWTNVQDMEYGSDGLPYLLRTNGTLQKHNGTKWITIRTDVKKMFYQTKPYERIKLLRTNGDVEEWGRNGGLHLTKYWTNVQDMEYGTDGLPYLLRTNGTLNKHDGTKWITIRTDVTKIFYQTEGYERIKLLRTNGDVEEWGRNGAYHQTRYWTNVQDMEYGTDGLPYVLRKDGTLRKQNGSKWFMVSTGVTEMYYDSDKDQLLAHHNNDEVRIWVNNGRTVKVVWTGIKDFQVAPNGRAYTLSYDGWLSIDGKRKWAATKEFEITADGALYWLGTSGVLQVRQNGTMMDLAVQVSSLSHALKAKKIVEFNGRIYSLHNHGWLRVDGEFRWGNTKDFAISEQGIVHWLGTSGLWQARVNGDWMNLATGVSSLDEVYGVVKSVDYKGRVHTLRKDGWLRVNGVPRWARIHDFNISSDGTLYTHSTSKLLERRVGGQWENLGFANGFALSKEGSLLIIDADGTIQIPGTDADDIVIIIQSESHLELTVNSEKFLLRLPTLGAVKSVYFEGRDGDDIFENYSTLQSIVHGNDGDDIIMSSTGDDRLYGGEGNDLIFAGGGNDFIDGNNGDDILYGEDNDDTIFGGSGSDVIYGGEGHDTISEMGSVAGPQFVGEVSVIFHDDVNFIDGGGGDWDKLVADKEWWIVEWNSWDWHLLNYDGPASSFGFDFSPFFGGFYGPSSGVDAEAGSNPAEGEKTEQTWFEGIIKKAKEIYTDMIDYLKKTLVEYSTVDTRSNNDGVFPPSDYVETY